MLDFSESDALDADDVVDRWVSVGVFLLAAVCAGVAVVLEVARGAGGFLLIVAVATVVAGVVLAVEILIKRRRHRQGQL